MKIMIDIDNTICDTPSTHYPDAQPIPERIQTVNKLYEQGHTIILWTARGTVSGIDWRELTENQLKDWGVNYHELWMGKPDFDLFIDDKAFNTEDFFI